MRTVNLFVFSVLLLLGLTDKVAAQDAYVTNKGQITFFANAPIADVDATNNKVSMKLNTSTGELSVDIDMQAFRFKNKKMGRDARRNYIEIDKFPKASFIGKISGKVDVDKPGSYPVKTRGKLKIHGVENEITEEGTIYVKQGQIRIHSEFDVALEDHKIERPKILGQEMTDSKVSVTVDATLSPVRK